MGYEVRITRQVALASDATQKISEQEWLALVEADPEFKREGMAQVSTPFEGELICTNPLLAQWLGHPHKLPVWFDFMRGTVLVKNPDEAVLKIKELTSRFGAHVQDDGREFYELGD